MAFLTKLKWILGISLVFLLIAATNLVDRSNFVQVKESVVTIYEDRLIAKDLIMDMYKSIQLKKVAILTTDEQFFAQENQAVNGHLNTLIERYEGTRLTDNEEDVFESLKTNIESLLETESDLNVNATQARSKLLATIGEIEVNLDDLSDIQISEGRRQVSITKRATDSIELFTQLEIYVLIFLAIVIQVIILYRPSKG